MGKEGKDTVMILREKYANTSMMWMQGRLNSKQEETEVEEEV